MSRDSQGRGSDREDLEQDLGELGHDLKECFVGGHREVSRAGPPGDLTFVGGCAVGTSRRPERKPPGDHYFTGGERFCGREKGGWQSALLGQIFTDTHIAR